MNANRVLRALALSTLLVLAAARPGPGQTAGRAPLVVGKAAYVVASETRVLSLSVFEPSGGGVGGHALIHVPSTGSFVLLRVTSAAHVLSSGGRPCLAMAGPILASALAPAHLAPGRTTFFAVQDGRDSALPDTFQGLGNVPLSLGNLSIQQILALTGPPPDSNFVPLFGGDLIVRED